MFYNQGCCGCGQYDLPDGILRFDANTTLNQSYVLFITLIKITYQSGDQYLPPIYSWDSSPWQVLYIPLFCVCDFLTVCRAVFVFFKGVINLTSFLLKSRFISLLLFINLFFTFLLLLIKQIYSHETVKFSRLFCLFVLLLQLKL